MNIVDRENNKKLADEQYKLWKMFEEFELWEILQEVVGISRLKKNNVNFKEEGRKTA